MSNAALPPNPMLEGSIFRESNQNMMQNPQNLFNFPMTPFAPFRTNQGYGLNETRPLDQVPTMQPMINNTMSSTVTQYNAANLDPKTLHNAAGLIPYGEARGQLSLTSNSSVEDLIDSMTERARIADLDKRSWRHVPPGGFRNQPDLRPTV